jgi:predicted transcriptional regulator
MDNFVVENYLKKIRVELGLTITDLSKLSNVSTTVISQLERMLIHSTQVTKNKIIKGLNINQSPGEKNWNIKIFSRMMGNDCKNV